MDDPKRDIEACRGATQRLHDTIGHLTDEVARRPSLLPGWSDGHVVTHLARNRDSVVRRLRAAAARKVVEQYDGGAVGRAAEIEAGDGSEVAAGMLVYSR